MRLTLPEFFSEFLKFHEIQDSLFDRQTKIFPDKAQVNVLLVDLDDRVDIFGFFVVHNVEMIIA